MESAADPANDLTIPAPLQAEIRAVAAIAHRPANEIVREALEGYLAERHAYPDVTPGAQTSSTTVARMLERRSGRHLSNGLTIEDVIAWGRDGRA